MPESGYALVTGRRGFMEGGTVSGEAAKPLGVAETFSRPPGGLLGGICLSVALACLIPLSDHSAFDDVGSRWKDRGLSYSPASVQSLGTRR